MEHNKMKNNAMNYIKSGASCCFFCGGQDIRMNPIWQGKGEMATLTAPVLCHGCGKQWEIVYQIVGVKVTEHYK